MPKISVISIAKRYSDFEKLRKVLDRQTFHDFKFKFIISINGLISKQEIPLCYERSL
jgi:hypothetical protein